MKRTILVLTLTLLLSSTTTLRAGSIDPGTQPGPVGFVPAASSALNGSSNNGDNVIPTDNVFGVVAGLSMILWFLG